MSQDSAIGCAQSTNGSYPSISTSRGYSRRAHLPTEGTQLSLAKIGVKTRVRAKRHCPPPEGNKFPKDFDRDCYEQGRLPRRGKIKIENTKVQLGSEAIDTKLLLLTDNLKERPREPADRNISV